MTWTETVKKVTEEEELEHKSLARRVIIARRIADQAAKKLYDYEHQKGYCPHCFQLKPITGGCPNCD